MAPCALSAAEVHLQLCRSHNLSQLGRRENGVFINGYNNNNNGCWLRTHRLALDSLGSAFTIWLGYTSYPFVNKYVNL